MEGPKASQNPEQGDSGHSDEHFDGSESRSGTDSTFESPGHSHPQSPVSDCHSSTLNSGRPTIDVDDLQLQNDELRRQNRALEQEVAQYQMDHLRELPEDHITDATAQRLYEGIQDAIEQWVYNVTGRSSAVDWLNKYEKRLHASIQNPKAGESSAVFKYVPRLFRDPKRCRASESIDCLFLSWFIAHSLAEYVFDNRYPLGIYGVQEDFLNHAIDAMRGSGCHYDEHYIDNWRTQTLAILMGHPEFGKSHEAVFDMEYERIRHNLLQWLPKEDLEEHEEELKEGIFREAVMLQQKMGLGADDYKIKVDSLDSRSTPDRKVIYRSLYNFRRIDAQDKDQICGCLFPPLRRIDSSGKPHYITGPVFIVDPASTESRQRSVEPSTRLRDRGSAKSSTEPITKSNERSSGLFYRMTDIDRDNSPRRRSKLIGFIRRSSSTQ